MMSKLGIKLATPILLTAMAMNANAGGDHGRPERPTPVPDQGGDVTQTQSQRSNLSADQQVYVRDGDTYIKDGNTYVPVTLNSDSNITFDPITNVDVDAGDTNTFVPVTVHSDDDITFNPVTTINSDDDVIIKDESEVNQAVDSSGQRTEINDNSVTNFEAAAAGSSAYAAPVYVPSACMSGWSFGASGAQVSGSGSFSFSKVTPAGVDLDGLTLRDYLLIGHGEGLEAKQEKRAEATKHLSEGDQERLSCLVAVIEEQEDIQAHTLEVQKDDQDFKLFYLYAQHALKNDGPGATTTTIRRENGDVVTTVKETDEASIQEHAAITMAIAERNPELMLWIGAFSEVEIDGSKSATQIVRDYMKNEINFDFKAEANRRIESMFAPRKP